MHNAGTLAEERAATYWEDLKALHQHVQQEQTNREQQLIQRLTEEGRERNSQSQTLAQELLKMRADIDEYILNRLPSLIDERVQQTLRTRETNNPTYTQTEVDRLVAETIQNALTSAGGEDTPRGTQAADGRGP
jgi:hypothetical protein